MTILDVMDLLTTPDAEDWTMLVDGQRIWCSAVRNCIGGCEANSGEGTLRDLKKIIRNLPPSHGLGRITFIVATDAEARGAFRALAFLQRHAREKNFSLMTIYADAPTKECWERVEQWTLRHCTPAGQA